MNGAPLRNGRSSIARSSHGFTLLELIMVIVLLGILGGIGATMFSDSFRTAQLVNAESTAVSQARYAMERLANEMRMIKYEGGQYVIATPEPLPPSLSVGTGNNSFSFTNGATNSSVSIALSGTTLTLNGNALVGDVSALTLKFFDKDLNAPQAPAKKNVRYVQINFTVHPADVKEIRQRTLVALRSSAQ